MDYQESRNYIRDAAACGSVLGLANITELMKRLEDMGAFENGREKQGGGQFPYHVIHVAGTNGKGSVIAFLYSMLLEAGYSVGRYNSPAVFSFRERFEADGRRISREEFACCMGIVAEAVSRMVRDGFAHPTVFELETAAAFLFFAERKCDIALIEVGMGGDLDATNVIRSPLLSVITSIGMDHMEYLGGSLGLIAEKKAGILKKGCAMVSARQEPEAEEVLRTVCRSLGIPYLDADPGEAIVMEEGCEGQRFVYRGAEYHISLPGVFQIQNAVLALRAVGLLGGLGFSVEKEAVKEGLSRASWDGRFMILGRDPVFIVDGAHNPPAARMLALSLKRYFWDRGRRLIYIIGMFKDKDIGEVLRLTCPMAEVILTISPPDQNRALSAERLCEAARLANRTALVKPMESVRAAAAEALRLAGPQDVIAAFGSLSFTGELCGIIGSGDLKRDAGAGLYREMETGP